MSKERQRFRNKSSIDTLPCEVRELVESLLSDINNTYTEISEELKERGYDISRSAVGRYAMRGNGIQARIRAMNEDALAIAGLAKGGDTLGVAKATNALVAHELAKRIAFAAEDIAEMPIDKAINAAEKLERITVNTKKFEVEYNRGYMDAVAAVKKDLSAALKDHPLLLAELNLITEQLVADREAE